MAPNSKRPPADRSRSTREEKSQTKSKRSKEGQKSFQGSIPSTSKSGYGTANNIPRSSASSQDQPSGRDVLSDYPNQGLHTDDGVNDLSGVMENFSLSASRSNPNEDYTIHRSSEFKIFRVLRMIWSEPRGSGKSNPNPTEITNDGFEKARRFVIMSVHDGHCLCLAISTYRFQGVTKPGVKAKDHAMIYSTELPPELIGNELERGLKTPGIKIIVSNPRYKLDTASRLNFAKIYTIEYNTGVRFIGRVHPSSERDVKTNFYSIHGDILSSVKTNAAPYNDNVRGENSIAFSRVQSTPLSPTTWAETLNSQQSSTYCPPSTTDVVPNTFAYAQVSQLSQGPRSNSSQPYSVPYVPNQSLQSTTTQGTSAFSMNYSSGGQYSRSSYGDTDPARSTPAGDSFQSYNQWQGTSYSRTNDLIGAGHNFSTGDYNPPSSSNQNYDPNYDPNYYSNYDPNSDPNSYQGNYFEEKYDNRYR